MEVGAWTRYVIVRSSLTYLKSEPGRPRTSLPDTGMCRVVFIFEFFNSLTFVFRLKNELIQKLQNKHISYTLPGTSVRKVGERHFLDAVPPFKSHKLPQNGRARSCIPLPSIFVKNIPTSIYFCWHFGLFLTICSLPSNFVNRKTYGLSFYQFIYRRQFTEEIPQTV